MAIAILFCCLFITFSSQSYVRSQSEQPSNQKYVSAESMQEYAQTIISTYNQNISGYFPKTTEGFSFYSNSSHYSIKAYISAQHGAALWIEPSITESFELTSVSDRIETAIFGGNWSTWAAFNGGFEVMISSLTLELNGHPLVNLPENSTLMLKDVFVNNTDLLQSYTCIILKGSNETKYWTPNWASYEANRIFEDDVRVSFTVSEEVRLRYAEPVLTARLKIIQEKLLNSSKQPYSYSDWLADMQEIEDIAKNQYHITNPSQYINGLIAFLNAQVTGVLPTFPSEQTPTPILTPSPTPTKYIFHQPVPDTMNLLYEGLFSSLPVMLFASAIATNFYKSTNRPREKKVLIGAIPVLLGAASLDLFSFPPYDFSLVSIQGLVIILVWVCGLYIVYKGRKRLICYLFPKLTKNKQSKKHANWETKKRK